MAVEADDETTTIELPSHEENPEERRRILNVLAQRRYRRRKQEKLKALERQVRSSNISSAPNSTKLSSTITPSGEESFESVNHHGQSDLGSKENGMAPFMFADAQTNLTDAFSYNQSNFTGIEGLEPVTMTMTSDSLEDGSFTLFDLSPFEFLQSDTASDFADYAVTTPGLSVIRAHTEIVRHMHGPNFQMDIWNPAAISPFCLGTINAMSSEVPAHYHPTPLQKSVQHHPVVDMLPWPSFRDRFLYVMSLPKEFRPRIAQGDMASVTFELMLAIKDAGGGLRVWNKNPFLAENWEIGPEFYSKFWWAIDSDVIKQSNRIRSSRGENTLRLGLADVT